MHNKDLFDHADAPKAHVIVVGNEKGGSGKSTVAMHIAVGLMRLGYKVGTIDLDSHQASLTSYMKNRWQHLRETGEDIPMPEHVHITRADGPVVAENRDQERWRVESAVQELSEKNDFIVIDTPGSDRYMSIVGHAFADTLVTPMNESFVDLDVLAKLYPHSATLQKPSIYADMVMNIKQVRPMRWFVLRNRQSVLDTRNKQTIARIVETLQEPLGFKQAPGLTERIIYRELFPAGLTLFDLKDGGENRLNMSNINARMEVRQLIRAIIPDQLLSTLSLLKTN